MQRLTKQRTRYSAPAKYARIIRSVRCVSTRSPRNRKHTVLSLGASYPARRIIVSELAHLAGPLSPRGSQPALSMLGARFASPNESAGLTAGVRGLQYKSFPTVEAAKTCAILSGRNTETLVANKGSIRDRASHNGPLSYSPDVRHPPFLTLRGSLLPNHQQRNQDGDKRPHKKKLVHKTPYFRSQSRAIQLNRSVTSYNRRTFK